MNVIGYQIIVSDTEALYHLKGGIIVKLTALAKAVVACWRNTDLPRPDAVRLLADQYVGFDSQSIQ